MAERSENPEIIFVVGPTASGKSDWALEQAVRTKGVICNADSVQVYKGLDIGAAKPTQEERRRVTHYLYDLVYPDQQVTAGEYRRLALERIEQNTEHKTMYFVGGSGFYIQALELGMYPVEEPSAETLALLDEWEKDEILRQKLVEHDPLAAEKISANDVYRTRRALEMMLTKGKSLTEIKQEFKFSQSRLQDKYTVQKIGFFWERDDLRKRVQERTGKMLKAGFLEEVEALLAQGYGDSRALKSVGYKECVEVLKGTLKREELTQAIETATMQLAKKQMSWFKRDPDIEWINRSPKS